MSFINTNSHVVLLNIKIVKDIATRIKVRSQVTEPNNNNN